MSARARGFESHPLRFFMPIIRQLKNEVFRRAEVPKLAEGTPLERVQVVNSGARVQIPPSAFLNSPEKTLKLLKFLVDKVYSKCYIYLADPKNGWLREKRSEKR